MKGETTMASFNSYSTYTFQQLLNSLPPTEEIIVRDMCDSVLIRAKRQYIESCTSFCRKYGRISVLTIYLDEINTKCINIILDC